MTIVTRVAKGAPLEHAELDNNFVELDSRLTLASTQISTHTGQIALLPKFYKDVSNNIEGLTDGSENLPMIRNPIEMLAHSSIGWSSTLVGTEENLATYTIKAGTLGPNSMLQIDPLWTYTNSANIKNLQIRLAGVSVFYADRTTSVKEAPFIALSNRNSLASQLRVIDSGYVTNSTNLPTAYTINFASDVVVQITGKRVNAGDTLKLEYYRILHYVGD